MIQAAWLAVRRRAARWLPQSLVARVFGLYTITLLVFGGGGLALFLEHQFSFVLEETQIRAETLGAVILPTLSDSAVIGDDDTIQRTLEKAIYHSSFESAAFIDLQGRRLQALRTEPLDVVPPQWLVSVIGRRLYDVNRPVVVGGHDYGVMRLHFAPEVVASELWRIARGALWLAVLSVVGGLLLIRWPLVSWLGHMGRLRSLEEELDRGDTRVGETIDADAPIELRQTFEVLNRAAQSLQAQRAQAAVTLSSIADAVLTLDAQGAVLLANPAAEALLGSAAAPLVGRSASEALPALFEAGVALQPWDRRALPLDGRDGRRHVVDATLSPINGPDGTPVGFVLACRDVSEQHELGERLRAELGAREAALTSLRGVLEGLTRASAPAAPDKGPQDDLQAISQLIAGLVTQLQERSDQLNAIFTLSPDGFVSFDAERRVNYVSPAFTRLTGLPEARVMRLDEAHFAALLAGQRAPTARPLDLDALRGRAGEPGRERIELERPAQRVLEIGLREGRSETISQVFHLRDVTHETEVDRMKSEFLSTAAHELRTPMASIYGFSELLLRREMPEARRKEVLQTVHRQTELMISIVNELLDLARIEARRGKDFVLETIDLAALVRSTVHDFKPPGERDAPELHGVGDAAVPVCVDRGKMQQALINVISNAYKYSPGGGAVCIDLRPATMPGRADDAAWALTVTDRGIGMTAEQLARVCERFYRADTTGNIPGTGLGMSIVKEIIELHGGQLQIDSAPGDGTRVTLWVPASEAPAAALPEAGVLAG